MLTRVSACPRRSHYSVYSLFLAGIFVCLYGSLPGCAQLPYTSGGPNSAFAQIDFGQIDVDGHIWDADGGNARNDVVDFGSVSPLDLEAPRKAIEEFKRARSLMKGQHAEEAIRFLQKAIAIYPKFVSAHNALGLAYLDQQDPRAREEFETAAKLDDQFAGSFLNLGVLALSTNDFVEADSNLEKAASLRANDPKILVALAFAENGAHKYAECLHTVQRVHSLDHRGMANVHYIAASAALSLQDFNAAKRELSELLQEDPANPLSPLARKQLDAFDAPKDQPVRPAGKEHGSRSSSMLADTSYVQTFPNSDHLAAQLTEISNTPDPDMCDTCNAAPHPTLLAFEAGPSEFSNTLPASAAKLFTIRQVVDETALFFSVSHHGRAVNDLSVSDIQVRDDNKAPDKILQFTPQSKLPLRLGLLIDTSDSIQRRFSFEKRAAEKFIEKVLNRDSDLAFVAGFNDQVSVTQDFTNDPEALSRGIERLRDGGETSVFDAVYFACWKLTAYPDSSRVAKVLVILTDGEDNSSHRNLKQSIEVAEAAGITVYSVSTAEGPHSLAEVPARTDADRVLQELSEHSGGEAIFPGSLNALDHYLAKLPDVIRSRYLIAYKPAHFVPNGKYRSIRVIAEKDGKRFHVHARKGYYARLAAMQK